jgi:hypothetical protein
MESIIDISKLLGNIHCYEPEIWKLIMDMVFIPCHENREGKHKYIRAFPKPGTNYIVEGSFNNNKSNNLEMVICDESVYQNRRLCFQGLP